MKPEKDCKDEGKGRNKITYGGSKRRRTVNNSGISHDLRRTPG